MASLLICFWLVQSWALQSTSLSEDVMLESVKRPANFTKISVHADFAVSRRDKKGQIMQISENANGTENIGLKAWAINFVDSLRHKNKYYEPNEGFSFSWFDELD